VATSAAAGVRSTQTGVFSADQARRGKDVYAGACQSCHTASDQNGPEFRKHWIGHDLGELFQYLRENMPQDNPGSLTVENATLVTAYIVQLNGLPAGPVPLPSDVAQLKQIRFDTLSKPR
jgi:mono/diheme cytochrome c family protein